MQINRASMHRQSASSRARPAHARRCSTLVPKASSSAASDKEKPDWTGDNGLSNVVNWMINNPVLYGIMKFFAKAAMKNSAQSRGVEWDGTVSRLSQTAELERIKGELEDKSMQYPSYYLQPFHAYEEGNMNWLATYEVEPATYAMAIRTFKTETTLSPTAAYTRLRSAITGAIKDYHTQHGLAQPRTIIDMGCSSGMSTRWFAQEFPQADITGMDLSPYFLSLAEYTERREVDAAVQQASTSGSSTAVAAPPRRRIKYVHGIAEHSGLANASQDMVVFNFVIHECPQQTIRDFVVEGKRVVKPGGVLAFVDNNPRSKTIQNLPPAIFTLMKSTEPWSDEYYSFDLEACMREAGFREVVTIETDHRHRTVMGIA